MYNKTPWASCLDCNRAFNDLRVYGNSFSETIDGKRYWISLKDIEVIYV